MAQADEAVLREAVALHQAGRLEEAAESYRAVLQRDPRNPNALNLLGMVHHQRDENATAAELLTRAVEVAPNVAGFHNNLGNVLLALRRSEAAEHAYRHAIELQPDYVEAHNNLGVALLGQGKTEDAIRQLVHTIDLRQNYPAARNNLGMALRARHMYKEAAGAYRDAIYQKPDYVEAWSNLAIALLAMGERDESVEAARKALQLKPDHLGAYSTLGAALELSGRRDEAIAAYREALKLRPGSRRIRFQLASLTGEESFDAAPPDFVAMLFDNYADSFDKHLVQGLAYRAPQLVVDAALSAGAKQDADVLDMGCGTGLCGPLLRPIARKLIGVDLSSRMIGHARERKVYDELFVDELVAFLAVRFSQFDLAVAADVLNYFGELKPVFAAAQQAMRAGGLIAFTVEKHEGEKWALNPSRRYAHALEYVRAVLAETGFKEVRAEEVGLRQEGGADVKGWLVVVRKP